MYTKYHYIMHIYGWENILTRICRLVTCYVPFKNWYSLLKELSNSRVTSQFLTGLKQDVLFECFSQADKSVQESGPSTAEAMIFGICVKSLDYIP